MPKLKHPKTGDVIETGSKRLAVDLKANHGYREVKETRAQSPVPAPAPTPKPAEKADKNTK